MHVMNLQNTVATDWSDEALTDEIAYLAAHIHAATYRLLMLVAELDRRQSWGVGFRSCADYLVWRIGLSPVAAREKVRVARALEELPSVGDALRKGEISYSKVRAITRVATASTEDDLLQIAKAGTTAQLERLVRAYRHVQVANDPQHEQRNRDSRYLQAYVDDDGMVVVKGRLDAEGGAVLLKALDVAQDALLNDSAETAVDGAAQRRADALGLIAQSALDHQMQRGSTADHTQVVLHVDAAALSQTGTAAPNLNAAAQASFEQGLPVSAETARRICCDASVVTIVEDDCGNPLNVGRKTRSIPPALRRALKSRDRTCRFPGCNHDRYLEAHHIVHWAHGGHTKLENTILLCSFHHKSMHEGGYQIAVDEKGAPHFYRQDGRELNAVPEPLQEPVSAEALFSQHDAQHLDINANTIKLWNGDRMDYSWAIHWLALKHSTTPPKNTVSPTPSSQE